MDRKGMEGGAAVFVFVMAAFLMLYILVASDDLNVGNTAHNNNYDSDYSKNKDYSIVKKVLVEESPGPLTDEGRTEYEYTIPSVSLFKTTDAEVIKKENSFSVKNGWFSKKSKIINFYVEDAKVIDNLLLTFNAIERKGILTVRVNGDVVFENKITKVSSDPIMLPSYKLKDGENKLEIFTSSVGLKFWSVNTYNLENVVIYADVTDISRRVTNNVFNIPSSRISIETAYLKFVPECDIGNVGKLKVTLNGKELFYAVPDCGSLNSILLNSAEDLRSGSNTLIFETDAGSYLVDRIKVKTELREKQYPTYYFNIGKDEWDDIRDKDYIANMTVKFIVPEDHYNDIKISVNGDHIGIFSRDEEFSEIIDRYLVEGNNYIRLIPEDDVDIVDFKVKIERYDEDSSSSSKKSGIFSR